MFAIGKRRALWAGALAMAVGAAGALLGLAPKEAAAGATVTKYSLKELAAYASYYDGTKSVWVNIYRTGSGKDRETWLYYGVYSYYSGYQSYGYGTIPNAAFQGSPAQASLEIDTTTVSGFTHYYGSGGLVKVDWKKTDEYSGHQAGMSKWQNGPLTTHSNYNYDYNSATASGSVVGCPLTSSTYGQLYWYHSGSHSVSN